MKAFAAQRGQWLVFWTDPFCFHVYMRCGDRVVPRAEVQRFCLQEAAKAREYVARGGRRVPAW